MAENKDEMTCTIHGHAAGDHYNGKTVFLLDAFTNEEIAKTSVKDKTFEFKVDGSKVAMYTVMLKYTKGDMFPLTVPVVTGEGNVEAYIGGKVVTTGTPSNDAIQDFLLAKEQFTDSLLAEVTDVEKVKTEFKQFLKDQIISTKETIVAIYILKSYASKFTNEEVQTLLNVINPAYVALY